MLRGLLNVSDLWCSELPTTSFSKLKNLQVRDCASLRNMFHHSTARGLANLKELIIKYCSKMDALVVLEKVEDEKEKKIEKLQFPRLIKLELFCLPNLSCHFTHLLELPLLCQIDIVHCPAMDAYSLGRMNTPNLSYPSISGNGNFKNAIQLLQEKGEEDMDVDEDVDEDALITTRTRMRTAITGMHGDEEGLVEVRTTSISSFQNSFYN